MISCPVNPPPQPLNPGLVQLACCSVPNLNLSGNPFLPGLRNLDKTISSLEMELAAARAAHLHSVDPDALREKEPEGRGTQVALIRRKVRHSLLLSYGGTNVLTRESSWQVHVVVGINTAFSSKKRRDSVRETWMPQGTQPTSLPNVRG